MPISESYTCVLGFAHILLLYLYQFHLCLPNTFSLSLSLSPFPFIIASGLRGNYKGFQTVVLETWDSPPTIILQINCYGLNWTHTLRSTEQLKVNTGENFYTRSHGHTYACARTHTPESTKAHRHERTDMKTRQMSTFSKHAGTNTNIQGGIQGERLRQDAPNTKPKYIMKRKGIQHSLKPIWCWRKGVDEKSYLISVSKEPTARAPWSQIQRHNQTKLCSKHNKHFHVYWSKDHTLINSTIWLIKAVKLCMCACVRVI